MKLLKLPLKKEMSLGIWTLKRPSAPEVLHVPVYSNAPFYQNPCVVPGQMVSTGGKIAEPRSSSGIPVFSPVNGYVAGIQTVVTASGQTVLSVDILTDKKNPITPFTGAETSDWLDATAERLRVHLRETGVMLGGKHNQPLCSLIENGPFHSRTLIINACESEPYVTSGQILLMTHALEILKGAEIIRRAAGLQKIIFAFSDDAGQAVEVLKSKIYFLKWEHVEARMFSARYPQDEPAMLLPAIDPQLGKLSPKKLQAWPLPDIAAVFAAYEAVAMGKPYYEKVVTVTGECIVQPQNVLLPLGITVADAVKACKGFLREPGRMLTGGPMRGRAVDSMQAPVSAETTALTALPKEHCVESVSTDCIRCGDCVSICPVDISPVLIFMAASEERYREARELGAEQCIGCGNCAYVCPSHLPLAETIQGLT